MYIDKVYLQQNYRRHPGDDPFLFGTVGFGVHINEGESLEEAVQMAENQLQAYINEHTHYPDHNHVEVRDVQVQKPIETSAGFIMREIESCQDLESLESYRLIAKTNSEVLSVFNNQLEKLHSCQTLS